MNKLTNTEIDIKLIAKLPLKFASRFKVIPIKEENDEILVAISDPSNLQVIDELSLTFGKKIKPVEIAEEEIISAIKKYYGVGADTVAKMVEESDLLVDQTEHEVESIDEVALDQDASVIQFVNQLLVPS
ncbi:MAG: hypothetical protein ABH873_07225 [Candidatus Firestonebacteria bacterium]